MAYVPGNISGPYHLGGLQARKIWAYDTTDVAATVIGAQYFNDPVAPRGFTVGDLIQINFWTTAVGAGGTLSSSSLYAFSAVVATSDKFPAELVPADNGAGTVIKTS